MSKQDTIYIYGGEMELKNSVWSDFKEKPRFESLTGDIDCDVLVVGGGMAGILAARKLRERGKNVVVAEAKEIGGGITKNTTAVLSAQHDTPYSKLIELHGLKKAKQYLDANLKAVAEFERLAKHIDCDFETKPSYLFSKTKDLSFEKDALKRLGYEAELTDKTDLPFEIETAVRFPNMAEFHPLKFLYAVARELNVYEHTAIEDIREHTAYSGQNKIRFKKAVVATHFPFLDRAGWFFIKMHQKRSYVVALEHAADVRGTYIDIEDEGFYFRNYNGLLLVGQGDHRTGTKTNALDNLTNFIKKYYPEAKIRYAWANQDCVTLDDLPYVGRYGSLEDVYTATGFNLWGMTNSMAAADLLADLIDGRKNENEEAFRTNRSVLRAQLIANFGFTLGNLLLPTVKRCPHLGCALKYNKKERTWDCPCHGSRFEEDGRLIDNPAVRDANVK